MNNALFSTGWFSTSTANCSSTLVVSFAPMAKRAGRHVLDSCEEAMFSSLVAELGRSKVVVLISQVSMSRLAITWWYSPIWSASFRNSFPSWNRKEEYYRRETSTMALDRRQWSSHIHCYCRLCSTPQHRTSISSGPKHNFVG